MPKAQGLTLTELLITLAVAAVVLAMATPSLRDLMLDNRVTAQANAFLTSLNLARSEAVKRGLRVVVCNSTDGARCAGAEDWNGGWIVFVDRNENGQVDPDPDPALDEPVLQVHGPLSGGLRLFGNAPVAARVGYTPAGFAVQMGSLALCAPRREDDHGRAVIINNTGRARIAPVSESTLTCEG